MVQATQLGRLLLPLGLLDFEKTDFATLAAENIVELGLLAGRVAGAHRLQRLHLVLAVVVVLSDLKRRQVIHV